MALNSCPLCYIDDSTLSEPITPFHLTFSNNIVKMKVVRRPDETKSENRASQHSSWTCGSDSEVNTSQDCKSNTCKTMPKNMEGTFSFKNRACHIFPLIVMYLHLLCNIRKFLKSHSWELCITDLLIDWLMRADLIRPLMGPKTFP